MKSQQTLISCNISSRRTPSDVNLIGVNGGKVECQIFGVPKPKVVWYKDFHPLKETFRVQAYHYPPDVYTLFIEDYITRVSDQLLPVEGQHMQLAKTFCDHCYSPM